MFAAVGAADTGPEPPDPPVDVQAIGEAFPLAPMGVSEKQ